MAVRFSISSKYVDHKDLLGLLTNLFGTSYDVTVRHMENPFRSQIADRFGQEDQNEWVIEAPRELTKVRSLRNLIRDAHEATGRN